MTSSRICCVRGRFGSRVTSSAESEVTCVTALSSKECVRTSRGDMTFFVPLPVTVVNDWSERAGCTRRPGFPPAVNVNVS